MWQGDYWFLLKNLIQKDFKIRYRNMSLGVFWSLLNPLVLLGVMTFVFTKIFPNNNQPHFALFILCGIVPYNFIAGAWAAGTSSILDNSSLIKRVSVPREIMPLASVLSNVVHLVIQIGLLVVLALYSGSMPNVHWLWLPVIWGLEVVFVCGLALITGALNVYVRDMRYVVESINTVLFWLVPVFYSFALIPIEYRDIYLYNPAAAMIMALRNVLMDGISPATSLLVKLTVSSFFLLGLGLLVFRALKQRFYDYL
jgi:ABC-type polysaccharide/polyol phosphate export permease